jgi:hypothetical protein
MHFPAQIVCQKGLSGPWTAQVPQKVSRRPREIHKYKKKKNLTASTRDFKTGRRRVQGKAEHRHSIAQNLNPNEPQEQRKRFRTTVKVKADNPQRLRAVRHVFTKNLREVQNPQKIKRRIKPFVRRRPKTSVKVRNALWRTSEERIYTTNK